MVNCTDLFLVCLLILAICVDICGIAGIIWLMASGLRV